MDKEKLSAIETSAERSFQPIHLEYIQSDKALEQDVYIHIHSQFVIYKKAGQSFTEQDRKQLAETSTKVLYLFVGSQDEIRKFYEQNLEAIVENTKISTKEKSEVLYKCALGIASDIFDKPFKRETVQRSKVVVDQTLNLLNQDSNAFVQMIALSGHDYYTYTHSVNVMTFTVTLLSNMGFRDPQFLKEAGMGALLHDIGKSKVPLKILNKPGKLTEDEWNVMKQHPEMGGQIVADARLPERGVNVIVQHHERINGKGYPHGLYGEAIPIASQAVSLADVYDAMTTNRCYQKARSPFDAFTIITKEMADHYNQKMLQTFIGMLNLRKKED